MVRRLFARWSKALTAFGTRIGQSLPNGFIMIWLVSPKQHDSCSKCFSFVRHTLITDNHKKISPTLWYLWAAHVFMFAVTTQWHSTGTHCKFYLVLVSLSNNKVSALGHCSKVPQDIANYFVVNCHSILILPQRSIYYSLVQTCLSRILSVT